MTILGGIYTADTSNVPGITLKQFKDNPNMVMENYIDYNMFFRARSRFPFMAYLNYLEKKKQYISDSKIVKWLFGDEEPTVVTLGASFVYGTDTTITLASDFNYLPIGMTMQLLETISTVTYLAEIRISGTPTNVGGNWRYPIEAHVCFNASAGTGVAATPTFTTAATVNLQTQMNSWDITKITQYLQRKPENMWNVMQHSVELLGEGEWQMGEKFYANVGMNRNALDKMWNMMAKMEKHILSGGIRVLPTGLSIDDMTSQAFSNSLEGGKFGGLPFFLQPFRTAPSTSDVTNGYAPKAGVRGQIYTINGSAFDRAKIELFLNKVTKWGNPSIRLAVGSPDTCTEFFQALTATGIGLSVNTAKITYPGSDSIWEIPEYQIGNTRVRVFPTHNMSDIKLPVVGPDPSAPSGSNYVSVNGKSLYFLDEDHISLAYYRTSKGTKKVKVTELAPTEESTISRMMIDWGASLVVTEPRAHGILGVSG